MHKIAGLNTLLEYKHNTLIKQAHDYITNEETAPDMIVRLGDAYLEQCQKQNPHLSIDQCEYIWTGSAFYNQLLDHQGFMLHSSAVSCDGQAYLFSAPSGTGKSTHTQLWLKAFGNRAFIINDDKPAIRIDDSGVFVYGTPWSGKSDLNRNVRVPLKAICFIERAETNWIRPISAAQAVGKLMNQTIRPSQLEQMDKLLACLDRLLREVPVYVMGCTISEEASIMAHAAMSV